MTKALAKPKLLSPIDILTVAFCSWILLYMLVGIALGRVENPSQHLPTYLSILTGVLILAWWDRSIDPAKNPALKRALGFLHGLYPVLLFGYFFSSSYSVNRIIFGDWIDPWFARIDHSIFGYYPSLKWATLYHNPWISELFHGAYFAYYPMIFGLPLYFWFKKPEAFKELIFALTFSFYMFYFLFSLLPVVGGRFFPEAMAQTKVYWAGPFTHIMAYIYNETTHLGGGFPSSHVGITIVLTISALRHIRPLGYVFVVIAAFLSPAIVYCQYHWFVDMLGGIVFGIVGFYLSMYVHSKIPEQSNDGGMASAGTKKILEKH